MKLSSCCNALLLPIAAEFTGDYTLECSNCGRYFEDVQRIAFTSDAIRDENV